MTLIMNTESKEVTLLNGSADNEEMILVNCTCNGAGSEDSIILMSSYFTKELNCMRMVELAPILPDLNKFDHQMSLVANECSFFSNSDLIALKAMVRSVQAHLGL